MNLTGYSIRRALRFGSFGVMLGFEIVVFFLAFLFGLTRATGGELLAFDGDLTKRVVLWMVVGAATGGVIGGLIGAFTASIKGKVNGCRVLGAVCVLGGVGLLLFAFATLPAVQELLVLLAAAAFAVSFGAHLISDARRIALYGL